MKSIARLALVGGGKAVTFGQAVAAGTEIPKVRRGMTRVERSPDGPDNENPRA